MVFCLDGSTEEMCMELVRIRFYTVVAIITRSPIVQRKPSIIHSGLHLACASCINTNVVAQPAAVTEEVPTNVELSTRYAWT